MGRKLSRRCLLRSASALVAIPPLEAMLSQRAQGQDQADTIPRRMGVFYFGTGMNMGQFTPAEVGKAYACPPILKPLERFREAMTVLSGTYLKYGGAHEGDYTFLTGARGKRGDGIETSISADQVAAQHMGHRTRYPSMQFSIKRGTGFGGRMRTLSWNKNGVPIGAESDPHAIFNRLFSAARPEDLARRAHEFALRRSVLDAVLEQARRLERRVGRQDRGTLDDYFSSVRDLERRLQQESDWIRRPKPTPNTSGLSEFKTPYDPDTRRDFHYETFAKMMYDLIALALQTDTTRIVTYVVRREGSGGVYPEFNVSKDYHSLSHHNNDPQNLSELAKVDTIYMRHWSHFLHRLSEMREADGSSLLDHTVLAFSSGMGIGHSRDRLPTAVFGGRRLGIRHQGHLRLPNETPLASLWHTMLDRMRVPVGSHFQDSTGVIRSLTA